MSIYRRVWILLLLLPIFLFSEETVVIKITPNSTISHEIDVEFSLEQELEGKKNKVFSFEIEAIADFSYFASNEIPEIKITQKESSLNFQAGPLNLKYKLNEENKNDTFWGSLRGQLPDTLLFPLVDRVDFLKKPNERYSILPIENVGNYIAFVHFFKDLTDNGIPFQKGAVYETKAGEKANSYEIKLKVKEITSKNVVLGIEGEFHHEQEVDEEKKVIVFGNLGGEIKIDKMNLLLIDGKINVETKAHVLPLIGEISALPMIQRGVFHGKLFLAISSKS